MLNGPELRGDLELYYNAFGALTTCRMLGGVLPGAIPWSAIDHYCTVMQIEEEQREDLFYHVERLDKSYLDWLRKQHDREHQRSLSEAKSKKGKRQ